MVELRPPITAIPKFIHGNLVSLSRFNDQRQSIGIILILCIYIHPYIEPWMVVVLLIVYKNDFMLSRAGGWACPGNCWEIQMNFSSSENWIPRIAQRARLLILFACCIPK